MGNNTEAEVAAAFENKLDLEVASYIRPGNTTSHQELAEMLAALMAVDEASRYQGHLEYFPKEGPYSYDKYQKHVEFMNLGALHRERIFMAGNRVGKFHRVSEPVLTPRGFVPIGDLVIGSEVCTPDGQVAKVTNVHDQGMQDLFRLHFNDGTYVDAGGPHLWKCKGPEERFRKVYTKNGRVWNNPTYGSWKVCSTKDIIDHVGMEPTPPRRYSLPVPSSIKYPDKEFPVDPYTLGAFLGDGSLKRSVALTTADPEMLQHIEWKHDRQRGLTYFFNGKQDLFRELKLFGLGSKDKFIPVEYKHSNQRLAVLQGLMDTDGYTNGHNHEYVSTSKQLAQDVADILRSLGIRCILKKKKTSWTYKGEHKTSHAWRVSIWATDVPLFRLSRKINAQNLEAIAKNGSENIIVKIEPAGRDACRCIEIDSEDKTYIVSNYVVSHNSITGGYEMTCHLTGIYPEWWEGKRFFEPTDCWAAGDTSQTTRDIVQRVLLGEPGDLGTGMIPKSLLDKVRMRPGVPDGVDSIRVGHTSGGTSTLGFKSYDQKRRSFQGTAKHAIWLDEEPPHEVYGECLMRTMTTGGVVFVTFTPLMGWTQFVTEFQKQVHLQEASTEGSGDGNST